MSLSLAEVYVGSRTQERYSSYEVLLMRRRYSHDQRRWNAARPRKTASSSPNKLKTNPTLLALCGWDLHGRTLQNSKNGSMPCRSPVRFIISSSAAVSACDGYVSLRR